MDEERENQRRTYRMCRVGFAMLSFALVLASVTTLLALAGMFFRGARVAWVFQTPFWHWVDTPIVWGSLVGAYLLWGRWSDVSWQRRAGLLVLMSTFDLVLWFVEHGDALGLRLSEVGHEWLRSQLGGALGWAEFALISGLACDLMAHLGVEQAHEAGKATRSLAATGAVVWMLRFCDQTIWDQWPLQQKVGFNSLESLLLFLGTQMIWAITLIQVTALTIATTRQTARVIAEMEHEDQESDLL